jgi:hypothetical protein
VKETTNIAVARLIRNKVFPQHPFASYADLSVIGRTVLDGETVCVDTRGRPHFKNR